jgi:nucleoid-associated protein EbfC
MFGNMMEKLQAMRQKMDEVKSRLENISVSGEAGEVKVTANGNRRITDIKIGEALLAPDKKEELEELLAVAINRAIEQAGKINEDEMAASAKDLLPGGLSGF